jgi:hypothetical protein
MARVNPAVARGGTSATATATPGSAAETSLRVVGVGPGGPGRRGDPQVPQVRAGPGQHRRGRGLVGGNRNHQ